jgi:4-carboxymuconolactone decarboxylase
MALLGEKPMITREDLVRDGEAMRERLFGSVEDGAPAVMRTLLTEGAYGAVWSRPGLAIEDRMICALAALASIRAPASTRRHVAAALDLGLTPRTIAEIFIQIGIYAGFAMSEEAVATANQVFAERGLPAPVDPVRDDALEVLTERGSALMNQLHGARATGGYASPDNKVTSLFYPLAIQYGYGEIWFRPGLDHRQRALVAVAGFTALKLEGQVAKFGQSALNMGLDRPEMLEAVIQTAPISGFAPVLNALAGLSAVLDG